jgi:hypothetical protein
LLRRKRKERPPWARRGENLFSRIGLLSGGVVEKACDQPDGWKVIPNSAALTFREKARREPPKFPFIIGARKPTNRIYANWWKI